ncbi:MAG: RNA-binding protein [Legionellales bacterium RIFCSPHIGHO2_12_FULL_37_14]|nr:MAG: RNA-binding protein [Legionellales bacterium RIFCSPHIGHO2_12_FULL_37_14]
MKQQLKAKAHALKPVVLLGSKGLTDAVLNEIDIALTAHELIKIKLKGQDKAARSVTISKICQTLEATLIQCIGLTAILYRNNI